MEARAQRPPLGGFPGLADLHLDLPFQSAEIGGGGADSFPPSRGGLWNKGAKVRSGTTSWCGMYRCIRPTADTTNCFLKGQVWCAPTLL